MNIVEVFAEAIWSKERHPLNTGGFEQVTARTRKIYLEQARAAIEAMRLIPKAVYEKYRCDKLWRDLNSVEVLNLWVDAALRGSCIDCGEEFDPVPNSGDKGRCDPCRKQYG